jgi:hypothetical protein
MATVSESVGCYEANFIFGALVLLAISFEGFLLARATGATEEEMDERQLSQMSLYDRGELAVKKGWLAAERWDEAQVLRRVRNKTIHPGAYVRHLREQPDVDLSGLADYPRLLQVVQAAGHDIRARFGRE